MLCGAAELHISRGCVWGEQRCCDMTLPGEANVEEVQPGACFPRQGDSTGNGELDAGGALGHQVSYSRSRGEPAVLTSLVFKESDPTFAQSKMVLLREIQQVMILC